MFAWPPGGLFPGLPAPISSWREHNCAPVCRLVRHAEILVRSTPQKWNIVASARRHADVARRPARLYWPKKSNSCWVGRDHWTMRQNRATIADQANEIIGQHFSIATTRTAD